MNVNKSLYSDLQDDEEMYVLDRAECPFSERFLQVIWNERRLSFELHLEDGRELKILSPGTWNVAAGPDFKSAALLIDGHLVTGDVEIHRFTSDWARHGHGDDSLYNGVVLHAVWEDDAPSVRDGIGTLVLSRHLHPEWRKLLWDLEDACYPYARQVPLGDCALRWAISSDERVMQLLESAGLSRFSAKSSALMRRAADCGQDQALYEAIFESLGYKNNRTQFLQIARELPLSTLQSLDSDSERLAILFGYAGLLPDATRDVIVPELQSQVADLWDCWWSLGVHPESRIEWNSAGTRPYNSPFRRIAAGIEMLQATSFRPAEWLLHQAEDSSTPKELLKRFYMLVKANSPWRPYRDFCHAIRPAADLIGRPRLLDMLANVFLPFLYGMDGGSSSDIAKELFMHLPLSQDNRLFKEAVQRFLMPPSRTVDLIKTACHQQGMLDIYKNFCIALDNNCQLCPFSAHN